MKEFGKWAFFITFGVSTFIIAPFVKYKEVKRDGQPDMEVRFSLENHRSKPVRFVPVATVGIREDYDGGSTDYGTEPVKIFGLTSEDRHTIAAGGRGNYSFRISDNFKETWQRGAGMLQVKLRDADGVEIDLRVPFNKYDLPRTNIVGQFK